MGDERDELAHLALHLGHRRHQPRRAAPPRRGRCGSGCRRGGSPRSGPAAAMRATSRSAPRVRRRRRALGRQHRGARLERPPGSRAPSASSRRPAARVGRAGASGGAAATKVPPPRPRCGRSSPLCTRVVSAWRRVEREMPSWSASSRSGGSWVPAGEQAEPDGRAEPLDGLLERRRRLDAARKLRPLQRCGPWAQRYSGRPIGGNCLTPSGWSTLVTGRPRKIAA